MSLEVELKGRFRNQRYKALINLRYTAALLGNGLLKNLNQFDITEAQYNVLRILRGFRDEAPLSIGFIKTRMLDRNSDVSRIVDRLLLNELVVRVENTADRRQKDISITDKGLKLLSDMLPYELSVEGVLKNLNDEEIETLNQLLDKARSGII